MIEPCGHFLLVEIEKVEEVTPSGLILVKGQREREQQSSCDGVIIAIGPDAWFDKKTRWANIGDKILIEKYAGFVIDSEKYGYGDRVLRLVNDEQVKAVIR